ncbi:MAG TPA: hypothetical protein VGF69_01415 [Thermoanaerobaculia bacterium]|jgi:hypothetical protein
MQHVRVLSLTEVDPPIAALWRDDQWIMWMLEPGLRWAPAPDGGPSVQFEQKEGYDIWPGTQPSPQTALTDPNDDRRAYVAYGQTPLDDAAQNYTYVLWVAGADGTPTRVQVAHPVTAVMIDPEIVNRPQP